MPAPGQSCRARPQSWSSAMRRQPPGSGRRSSKRPLRTRPPGKSAVERERRATTMGAVTRCLLGEVRHRRGLRPDVHRGRLAWSTAKRCGLPCQPPKAIRRDVPCARLTDSRPARQMERDMHSPRHRRLGTCHMPQMTTAEAIVEGLVAHRLDTIYALPGVQNDHLFDGLFKAQDRIRTVHTRHEQGAAYMALGAALATGKPQAFAVVPGPGLLNASAALLTAYSMNAPVLALIGQIPHRDIGRKLGQLHEINDQAGIIARLVDHPALIPNAEAAPRMVAEAFRAMRTGRPGPAALACPINVWGKPGNVTPCDPLPAVQPPIDEDALRDAAKRLAAAKNPMIVVGGGAQDA